MQMISSQLHRRTGSFVRFLGLCLLVSILLVWLSGPMAKAETATVAEMEQVCKNFLSQTTSEKGSWNGDYAPSIVTRDYLYDGSLLLAGYYGISGGGFVLVPSLKEMSPVKAYSETSILDERQEGGFLSLIREQLIRRYGFYKQAFGSLDVPQPSTGDVVFARGHRKTWDRMSLPDEEFLESLSTVSKVPAEQGGPLLTTSWHQRAPYNNLCPMGNGDLCVVGCVATATAQILRYWNWPPEGAGTHSYLWDGDDTCDDPIPISQTLFADYQDTYEWLNMPESCDVSCNPAEELALAELCYEVGVAFEMDYGACGSGAWTSYAQTVFPTYFKYSPYIWRMDRYLASENQWYNAIKSEVDLGRPIQYRVSSHSIVCDGYRDDGGQFEYHMNYGWGGSFTAWFVFDSLYCYWEPDSLCPYDEEYMVLNIEPLDDPVMRIYPFSIGDGEYLEQGETRVVNLMITNSGYMDLDVYSMGAIETEGPAGWLEVPSMAPFTVGTAMSDTVIVPVTINPAGFSDPGNATHLLGGVYITSNSFEQDSGAISVEYYMADEFIETTWDTVCTTEPWSAKSAAAAGDHVGLVVSNYGSFGKRGSAPSGGANMDFSVAGGECDLSALVYLYDGSLFVIRDAGDSVYGSTGIYLDDSSGPDKLRPVNTGVPCNSGTTGDYDSVYTGGFTNWDSSVVMDRTYYAPRNLTTTPSFVVTRTRVYSGKGETVDHLTFGSIIDWDIPSWSGADNTSGIQVSGNYPLVFMRGYDGGGSGCQPYENRYGGEAFMGWRETSAGGGLSPTSFASMGADRNTWFTSFGTEIDFDGFLDTIEVASAGMRADPLPGDQVIVSTWHYDRTLEPLDTLEFVTILATVHDGDLTDLAEIVDNAGAWYASLFGLSCCLGTIGNVQLDNETDGCDNVLDQDVDITDVTNMISHLFTTYDPICCIEEADLEPLMGGQPGDGAVDVADLTTMIDHLFISYQVLPPCP